MKFIIFIIIVIAILAFYLTTNKEEENVTKKESIVDKVVNEVTGARVIKTGQKAMKDIKDISKKHTDNLNKQLEELTR